MAQIFIAGNGIGLGLAFVFGGLGYAIRKIYHLFTR